MKKKAIVFLGVCVLLLSSVGVYGSQEKKALEDTRSEKYANEAQRIYNHEEEHAEEVIVDVADRDHLNGQDIEVVAESRNGEEKEVADVEKDQGIQTEEEPIIETEDETIQEMEQEKPVVEETEREEPIVAEEPVAPDPTPVEEETSPLMTSFSEIFIKEEINVVENPDTVEEFEAVLLHMCETSTFTYSIEYFGISFDELLTEETQGKIAQAFDSIFNKYPEYMSFTNRMTYRAQGASDKVTLTFILSSETGMDEETLATYREAFFEESLEIIGTLEDSGMLYEGQSDEEKALVLFDWVVQNTEYDDSFNAESYTGYGVYANGLGVCQGYTAAYNALSKCAGLRVEGVGGVADGVDHIWTRALFAGEDVYIDATWGDSYVNSDNSNYDYFLADGDTLAETHTWQ